MILRNILIIASLIVTAACSDKPDTSAELLREESPQTKVKEREIYDLGHKAGVEMLNECTDIEQIETRLLDTRARINLIRGRVDDQAASDYTHGFTDAIRENCDSLARILEL